MGAILELSNQHGAGLKSDRKMVKRYMVPMFALVTQDTEAATESVVAELQKIALKHGFSLLQDELIQPKSFDDSDQEIHSILDLVTLSDFSDPYKADSAILVEPLKS
jgi:hypothetical protein